MARIGMKRAVGQARRAVERFVAAVVARSEDDLLTALRDAAQERLKVLGDLWEGAVDQTGVEITRVANEVLTLLELSTIESFRPGRDSATEQANLNGFVRDCNRLFPGN